MELITNPAIKKESVRCGIVAYCTPQSTGKACFDDIHVTPYVKSAVGAIFSSSYRNVAASGKVDFRVDLCIPHGKSPDEFKGVFSYFGADGGRKTVEVKPFLGDLDWAEGAMALPDGGCVKVRVGKKPDGLLDVHVESPDGVRILR